MRGAILTLPNTPSWRGVQLKKCTGTYLYLFTFRRKLGSIQLRRLRDSLADPLSWSFYEKP